MIERRAAARWALLAVIPLLLGVFGVLVETRGWFPVLRFAIERTPERAPSAVAVSRAERARGVPTVSLYVRPGDLHDPLRTPGIRAG